MKKGQSILEVIIAVSIVIIISSSAVTAVLGAFSSTRLAEEETQAALYAFEAMEAVQSIRNRGWDNLVDGTYGLSNASGQWEFSGTEDTNGKYTRSVTIVPANRDLNGDIVNGVGIEDDETKRITASVSWDFTPTRNNSVEYSTYLTNWSIAIDPTSALSGPTSCAEYCQGSGYPNGICRNNANQCNQNGEVNLTSADQFCNQNPANTCCCQP